MQSICGMVHNNDCLAHLRKYLHPSDGIPFTQIDEVDESAMIYNRQEVFSLFVSYTLIHYRDFKLIIAKWFEKGNTFNLSRIEEDVVAVYFAEKPLINGEEKMRRLYKFKEEPKANIGLE